MTPGERQRPKQRGKMATLNKHTIGREMILYQLNKHKAIFFKKHREHRRIRVLIHLKTYQTFRPQEKDC